jgi:hypothetical protein
MIYQDKERTPVSLKVVLGRFCILWKCDQGLVQRSGGSSLRHLDYRSQRREGYWTGSLRAQNA